jgi:hypothetical protein
MPDKGSEFIVKLNGIKLSADAEARIDKAIRSAVMQELARTDLKGDTVALIPRKEWMGIWLDVFRAGRPQKVPILRVEEIQG